MNIYRTFPVEVWMLTKKQLELFNYIYFVVGKSGVAPSFDEMKDALELKSKSGIHRLISGLEERGFIKKLSHRARAIEILKLPPGVKHEGAGSNDDIVKYLKKTYSAIPDHKGSMASIPLMGRIAAGSPLEAINDFSQNIQIPNTLIGNGRHYALEVNGESMLDAGICDGDTILVREQQFANNGEIVVALIAGQEATLKKFVRNGDEVILKAENAHFKDQIYPASEVQIQGKLVGLLRSY